MVVMCICLSRQAEWAAGALPRHRGFGVLAVLGQEQPPCARAASGDGRWVGGRGGVVDRWGRALLSVPHGF